MNYYYLIIPVVIIFLTGIRIVRPTHRGLLERLGKYRKLADSGFHWIIPVVDRIYMVNITEQMVDCRTTRNYYQ
jgi:regulator of protease activity HflC (stomatin/prohibitin superfamily)